MKVTKDLVAASATPMVLGILAEGESYGYAILRRINELSGGELDWTEGLLYPLLHRLERLGHVESSWQAVTGERRRKYYRITNQGLAELAEQRRQWDTVVDALKEIWLGSERPPAVHRDPDRRPGMTAADAQDELETQFAQWREYVQRRRELQPADADELEDHLRGSVDELVGLGLRRRRGVPGRGQAHGQPGRPVPRVRPRALGTPVEATRARPAMPTARRWTAGRGATCS